MDHDRKIGGEAGRLFPPVVDHRGGADQKHRSLDECMPIPLNEGQGLNGLAQAHIIGQAGAQPPFPQEGEPRITPDLVGPQGPLEFSRSG